MKPIRISIEINEWYPLYPGEIKYVFQTLLTIAGLSWKFISRDDHGPVDIYFGESCPGDCRLFIQATRLAKERISHPKYCQEESSIVFFFFS